MSASYPALSREELLTALAERKNTLVLFHRGPDADALGSALALREMLEQMGSRSFCVCADECPARLRFLLEGVQESICLSAVPADFEPQRILTVDTASPSQMGALEPILGKQVELMIDHHGKGEPYAPHYIRPKAAATGEILFDLAEALVAEGRIEWTASLRRYLYAAITSDTGGFRYSNVTPATHLCAARLIEGGVPAADLNHRLLEERSPEQLRATAAAINALRLCADGRVAIVCFSYARKQELGLLDEHLDTVVDIARSVSGVEVAVSMRQPQHTPFFRVSMRSNGAIDVSSVAARFGGGGHAKAAGCTVEAADETEAIARVMEVLSPLL